MITDKQFIEELIKSSKDPDIDEEDDEDWEDEIYND